jgi:hypothetical protein
MPPNSSKPLTYYSSLSESSRSRLSFGFGHTKKLLLLITAMKISSLGLLFSIGTCCSAAAVPPDLDGLAKACNSGKSLACNDAGVLSYKDGKIEIAMGFYKRACEKGLGISCSNYGCFFDPYSKCKKTGPPQPKMAQEYYEKACEMRASEGCCWRTLENA